MKKHSMKSNKPSILAIILSATIGIAAPIAVIAETVAVIGTGSVGAALGPRFASIGHQVIYGSRTPAREDVIALVEATGSGASAAIPIEAARDADIVIIAVPWTAAETVVLGLGDLSGKIIIDPINPRVVNDEGYADYPSHISMAEQIQALAPNAYVVKAFSTISADTMIDPTLVDHPITIPLVGNSTEAKQQIAGMLDQLGYDSIDFGPVRYAHIVEGLYLLRTNARLKDIYYEWNYPRSRRAR